MAHTHQPKKASEILSTLFHTISSGRMREHGICIMTTSGQARRVCLKSPKID